MLEVVLVHPEIPQNTGSIGRTCVATGTKLHLVRPLGFSLDQSKLKRAGLDYWPHLKLQVHDDWAAFRELHRRRQLFCFSTHAPNSLQNIDFPKDAMLVFGSETKGLDEDIVSQGMPVRIPMMSAYRSLNLGNAVAVAVYEWMRQHGYPDLT